MYTKNDFGRELIEEINNNFDITEISKWAHGKYLDNTLKIDRETCDAIIQVIAMEEGIEFEFTKEELLEFANNLQK